MIVNKPIFNRPWNIQGNGVRPLLGGLPSDPAILKNLTGRAISLWFLSSPGYLNGKASQGAGHCDPALFPYGYIYPGADIQDFEIDGQHQAKPGDHDDGIFVARSDDKPGQRFTLKVQRGKWRNGSGTSMMMLLEQNPYIRIDFADLGCDNSWQQRRVVCKPKFACDLWTLSRCSNFRIDPPANDDGSYNPAYDGLIKRIDLTDSPTVDVSGFKKISPNTIITRNIPQQPGPAPTLPPGRGIQEQLDDHERRLKAGGL